MIPFASKMQITTKMKRLNSITKSLKNTSNPVMRSQPIAVRDVLSMENMRYMTTTAAEVQSTGNMLHFHEQLIKTTYISTTARNQRQLRAEFTK